MKKLLILPFMLLVSQMVISQAPVKAMVVPQGNKNISPAKLASLKKIALPVFSMKSPVVQRIVPTSGPAGSAPLLNAGISISKSRFPPQKTNGVEKKTRDGASYCTSEEVSEKNGDYTKIVLGNQNDKIYPGVIYYDNAVIDGSYNAPAGMQLNPYDINISLFSAASSASTIVNVQPTMGNVNDGIAQLMRRQSNVINAGMVTISGDYMYSSNQLSFFLQSGFQGFGVDMNTDFSSSITKKKNIIFIKLHQVYFSVSLNGANGSRLVSTAALPSNLVYVNKVNYGRIGILRVETDYTKEEVKSAIDFSLNAMGTNTNSANRISSQRVLSASNVEGFFFGGDAANTVSVFSAADLAQFNSYVKNGLRLDPNVAPVPVSYELKYLNDNASAAINATTAYTQKTCTTAKALSVKLNGISIEDIHGGDCSYAWGNVELEVWETANGVKSKMMQPIENGAQLNQTRIWNVADKANPQRNITDYKAIRENKNVNINNVNRTWNYDLDPAKVASGEIMIIVKSNINTNHKDNDLSSLGFHGMGRQETASFSLAQVLIKNAELSTKGKYGSMIAGPYSSNSNRLHNFRAHFTVTAGN